MIHSAEKIVSKIKAFRQDQADRKVALVEAKAAEDERRVTQVLELVGTSQVVPASRYADLVEQVDGLDRAQRRLLGQKMLGGKMLPGSGELVVPPPKKALVDGLAGAPIPQTAAQASVALVNAFREALGVGDQLSALSQLPHLDDEQLKAKADLEARAQALLQRQFDLRELRARLMTHERLRSQAGTSLVLSASVFGTAIAVGAHAGGGAVLEWGPTKRIEPYAEAGLTVTGLTTNYFLSARPEHRGVFLQVGPLSQNPFSGQTARLGTPFGGLVVAAKAASEGTPSEGGLGVYAYLPLPGFPLYPASGLVTSAVVMTPALEKAADTVLDVKDRLAHKLGEVSRRVARRAKHA